MIDYDEKHWAKPCPKVDCHKKCACGLSFYSVPAVLGEKPEKGLYCNAIVQYEATGAVYIYSAEGIPVKVKEGTNGTQE